MRKCPICERELGFRSTIYKLDFLLECPNMCYKVGYRGGSRVIYIFETYYLFNESQKKTLDYKQKIKSLLEQIDYWKTDFRYIAEFLTR